MTRLADLIEALGEVRGGVGTKARRVTMRRTLDAIFGRHYAHHCDLQAAGLVGYRHGGS